MRYVIGGLLFVVTLAPLAGCNRSAPADGGSSDAAQEYLLGR